MMNRFARLLPLLLLIACTSPAKQYLASDAAKVVVTNQVNVNSSTSIGKSGTGRLMLTTYPNASDCSGGEQHFPEIGGDRLADSPSTSAPISLEPGKERVMRFFTVFNEWGRSYDCLLIISFVPKSKAEYEIVFYGSSYGCSASVRQKVNGQFFYDKTVKSRKPNPGLSSKCEKL